MNILNFIKKFSKNIWFFPFLLTILFIILVSLKVNGSSIGIYNEIFNGNKHTDKNLIIGNPNKLRSDEWIVNSQMAISQANNNYKRINNNIGNGQDMSILLDVPYKEWSVIFKPQNLAFFIMPFDYAFAFKWWIIGYLLILSVYFFVLSLLPEKKLFASMLAFSIFFSPFVQWWYLYGTLGSIYYTLFAATVFIKILQNNNTYHGLAWSVLLIYILACFALILYPPFQIPAAIALCAFIFGYFLNWANKKSKIIITKKIIFCTISLLATVVIVALYIYNRMPIIEIIKSTAYPGARIQHSGGFDIVHLASSHLSSQLQYPLKASHYFANPNMLGNQSEASNFVLLAPFLLIPSLYLIVKRIKARLRIDYAFLFTNLLIVLFAFWIFIPKIDILGKLTFLSLVPHARIIIGLGILGIIQLMLFIKLYGDKYTSKKPTKYYIIAYCILVLIVETIISLYVHYHYPGYIGLAKAVLFSLPIPIIIYLILTKKYLLSILIYLLFSFIMSYKVNPLYIGTDILSKTPISNEIKNINNQESGIWVSEEISLENFAFMNGARSYSGVYTYPQLEIWRNATKQQNEYIYNRYAHTVYNFDRDIKKNTETDFMLVSPDNFAIATEPCGDFMKNHKIDYIITTGHFDEKEKCTNLIKEVKYPGKVFYIYKLNY